MDMGLLLQTNFLLGYRQRRRVGWRLQFVSAVGQVSQSHEWPL